MVKPWSCIFVVTAILSILLITVAQPTFQFPVLYEPPKPEKVRPSPDVTHWISELSNPSADRRRIAFERLLDMGNAHYWNNLHFGQNLV